jgi:hypothetical protein
LVEKAVPFMALRGEMVYHSNDIASEVCFIVRGRIRIRYADGYDGSKERIVGFATQGSYFGEQEFYKRSPRVASYEAVQTASLLSLDYAHLGEAIEAQFGKRRLGVIRPGQALRGGRFGQHDPQRFPLPGDEILWHVCGFGGRRGCGGGRGEEVGLGSGAGHAAA